jgi:hypothetical protein
MQVDIVVILKIPFPIPNFRQGKEIKSSLAVCHYIKSDPNWAIVCPMHLLRYEFFGFPFFAVT